MEYLSRLRAAVADVVARQRDVGIDLVNDGEFGHSMGQRYDYGSPAKGAELASRQLWR